MHHKSAENLAILEKVEQFLLTPNVVQVLPPLIRELLDPVPSHLPSDLHAIIHCPGPGASTWKAGAVSSD